MASRFRFRKGMKINFENGVFFKVTYLILLAYALGKEALLGFGV